jgi:hypothetical protein
MVSGVSVGFDLGGVMSKNGWKAGQERPPAAVLATLRHEPVMDMSTSVGESSSIASTVDKVGKWFRLP